MARSAVERVFTSELRQLYSPEAMRLALIATARQGIADFIGRQPEKLDYTIQVNGVTVTNETAVGLGPATITYTIQRLAQVARYAYNTAVALSPKGPTGRYKQAWFIIADNVETPVNQIGANVQEIMLINDEDYARKLHVRGARLQGIPPGIVERVRQIVLRRFGGIVYASLEFHTLAGGYILKTNTRRHRAGEQMTYPTLVIRSKM